MVNYRLTKAAELDLSNIFCYTAEKFGLDQAREYHSSFYQEAFTLISENPRVGRDCSAFDNGLRRFEHRSHSIYYEIEAQNSSEQILILRVLGGNQDPLLHIIEPE